MQLTIPIGIIQPINLARNNCLKLNGAVCRSHIARPSSEILGKTKRVHIEVVKKAPIQRLPRNKKVRHQLAIDFGIESKTEKSGYYIDRVKLVLIELRVELPGQCL